MFDEVFFFFFKKKIKKNLCFYFIYIIFILIGVRIAFLPDYPLILSLLKHKGVKAFLK